MQMRLTEDGTARPRSPARFQPELSRHLLGLVHVQFCAPRGASGSNLTFESWKGFPSGSLHASLAHANRNFHFSQAC